MANYFRCSRDRYDWLKLPRFDGSEPDTWIERADEIIHKNRSRLGREEDVLAATMSLTGEAFTWYQQIHRIRPVCTWSELKLLVKKRFHTVQVDQPLVRDLLKAFEELRMKWKKEDEDEEREKEIEARRLRSFMKKEGSTPNSNPEIEKSSELKVGEEVRIQEEKKKPSENEKEDGKPSDQMENGVLKPMEGEIHENKQIGNKVRREVGNINDLGNSKIRRRRLTRVLRNRRNQMKKREGVLEAKKLGVSGKKRRRKWPEMMRRNRRRRRWRFRGGEGCRRWRNSWPEWEPGGRPWNRREHWKGMEQSNEEQKWRRRCYGQWKWGRAALQWRSWRKGELGKKLIRLSVPNGLRLELENKAQVKIMHLGQFKGQNVGPNSFLMTKDFEWALEDVADQEKEQPPILNGFSQNLVHGPGFSQNKAKPKFKEGIAAATNFDCQKNIDLLTWLITSVFDWLALIFFFFFAWQCIGRGWSCSSVITSPHLEDKVSLRGR